MQALLTAFSFALPVLLTRLYQGVALRRISASPRGSLNSYDGVTDLCADPNSIRSGDFMLNMDPVSRASLITL